MSDENKKPESGVSIKDLRALAEEPFRSFRQQAERAMASLYPAHGIISSYREMLEESGILAQINKANSSSFAAAAAAQMTSALPGQVSSKQLQELRAHFELGTTLSLPSEEMRKQLNELGSRSYFGSVVSSSAADQLKRFAESVLSQPTGFAEMARAMSVASPVLVDYHNSALYSFLSQQTARSVEQLERLQADYEDNFELVDVDVEDLGEPLELRPELEKEIIAVVQAGRDFSELSSAAKKYFLVFWRTLWIVIGGASAVVTLYLAYQSQEASIEAASSSREIRQSIHCISPEHRVYLEGCGVVTRDDVIVRAEGTKESKELLRLPAKTMVDVLESHPSGWVRISVRVGDNDINGWISARYLLVY